MCVGPIREATLLASLDFWRRWGRAGLLTVRSVQMATPSVEPTYETYAILRARVASGTTFSHTKKPKAAFRTANKPNQTCQAAEKEEKDSEREEPSVIARSFAITSRVSPSPPSVVSPVVVELSVSPDSSTKRLVEFSRCSSRT